MTSPARWSSGLLLVALAACGRDAPVPVAEPVTPMEGAAVRAPAPPVASAVPSRSTSAAPAVTAADPPPTPDEFAWPDGYTPTTIWEEKKVVIDGVTETWSLRWRSTPRFNGCEPTQGCACDGLTWGLSGDLDLVRERPGAPIERLDLAAVHASFEPHFEGQGVTACAAIPGFERTSRDDGLYDKAGKQLRAPEERMTEIVKRRHVQVMKLRDYDHDGLAAEFVFQVGYLACGQNPSVLVGVSRDDMHLHVLGGIEMTYLWEWDHVLAAHGKSVDVELHACGDHGGPGIYATVIFDPAKGMQLVDDPKWECVFDQKTGFKKRRAKPR